MNIDRRIIKDTMDSFAGNYINFADTDERKKNTDTEAKKFLTLYFDKGDEVQVEHWFKYYQSCRDGTNTRVNPRYNLDKVIPQIKSNVKTQDITDCMVEFNKSHPLQNHLKEEYVLGWVNQYLHSIKGYEVKQRC